MVVLPNAARTDRPGHHTIHRSHVHAVQAGQSLPHKAHMLLQERSIGCVQVQLGHDRGEVRIVDTRKHLRWEVQPIALIEPEAIGGEQQRGACHARLHAVRPAVALCAALNQVEYDRNRSLAIELAQRNLRKWPEVANARMRWYARTSAEEDNGVAWVGRIEHLDNLKVCENALGPAHNGGSVGLGRMTRDDAAHMSTRATCARELQSGEAFKDGGTYANGQTVDGPALQQRLSGRR